MDAGSVRKESGLEDQGRDVHAIISSSAITANDLRAGLFRNAEITEYVVDWRFPFFGPLQTNVYWIQQTEWDGDELTAEIAGSEARLRNEAGNSYGLECKWDLGAAYGQSYAGCKVDLTAYTAYNLEVGYNYGYVIEPRRSWHLTYLTTGEVWDEDDFFSLGRVYWTSGANRGLWMDVKRHTRIDSNDWEIELMFDMPFDIEDDAQFNIQPGCNKISGIFNSEGHCKNRYSALAYFSSFPYMPGTDKMLQRPRV